MQQAIEKLEICASDTERDICSVYYKTLGITAKEADALIDAFIKRNPGWSKSEKNDKFIKSMPYCEMIYMSW